MPRIKAYTMGNNIIPIDIARVRTVFKCPWTGNMFLDKKAYVKHLKTYRTERIHERIKAKNMKSLWTDLHMQGSFPDIIRWIENHPEFMYRKLVQYLWGGKKAPSIDKFWCKITYLDVEWYELVSNSHSAPFRGVTNWGGRDTYKDGTPKPRGYPGYWGRIEFQFSHDIFNSEAMRELGINTGTGGGISDNRYGFEVKFFEEDWTGFKEYLTLQRLTESDEYKKFSYGKPVYFR